MFDAVAIDGVVCGDIARLNADGSLDRSFDPGVGVNSGSIATLEIQPDGMILIGGTIFQVDGVTRTSLARLNTNGNLDTGYSPKTGFNNWIPDLVQQSDGKLIAGGGFTEVDSVARKNFARLNANGILDASFDPGMLASHFSSIWIGDLALQTDGKILAAGIFTDSDNKEYDIIRLNTDGSLDSSFNPVVAELNGIRSVISQPDGKILIGGPFDVVDGVARSGIARLNVDGSVDTSFDPGAGANNSVGAIVLQPDGKIVIGGYFTEFDGSPMNRIARLNANGSLDTTFDPGTGADKNIRAIVLQPDGKVLIGGDFDHFNGYYRKEIARLNANGSLDTSFYAGSGTGTAVLTIALQPDGKVLIGGDFGWVNGVVRNNVARLHSNGSLDTSFDPGSGGRAVHAIVLQQDGKIVIGGSFVEFNGIESNRIARLNDDGSVDTSFGNVFTGVSGWVQTLTIQTNNKTLIGGLFTDVDGVSRNHIARLDVNRNLDSSFDPGTGANDWVSSVALQPDGKVLIGGNFTEYDGVTRNYIARLHEDGSLDIGFITHPSVVNDNVRAIAQQPDGKILVGGFFGLVRLNQGGSRDVDFDLGTGVNSTVYSIVQQLDGKILIAGSFTKVNGVTRNRIARLNPDGSIDTNFNPGSGANGPIYSLALQPDGKVLIGGNFTSINGTSHEFISRLNTNGTVDTSFNPGTNLNDLVLSMALQADGKIVIGGFFTEYDGISHNRIARLNADGSLDTDFDLSTGANSSVETMALQGDGSIVIGGHFTEVDGIEQNYISRLSQSETALQQLEAAIDGKSVTWLRDGVGPVLERVTFEVSDSLYGGWTMLGSGQHTAGGWSLDGLNFPVGQNIYIRARGYYGTNASSMTESILQFYLEKPSILVAVTVKPSVLKEPGGTVTFNVSLNNTSATNTVTIDTLTDTIYGNLNGEGNCSVPRAITAGARYSCTYDADITGSAGVSETDKVTASGADEYGNPVSDSDSATVNIIKDGGCVYYTPKNKSSMMICW